MTSDVMPRQSSRSSRDPADTYLFRPNTFQSESDVVTCGPVGLVRPTPAQKLHAQDGGGDRPGVTRQLDNVAAADHALFDTARDEHPAVDCDHILNRHSKKRWR